MNIFTQAIWSQPIEEIQRTRLVLEREHKNALDKKLCDQAFSIRQAAARFAEVYANVFSDAKPLDWEPCAPGCPGWGWFNDSEVQRCDSCDRFKDDDEALEHVAQVAWIYSRAICGHSACRQNWIDTGESACIEDRCSSCDYLPPRHAPGCEIDVDEPYTPAR